jgi:lauroyl/myristoyl acyltransferase
VDAVGRLDGSLDEGVGDEHRGQVAEVDASTGRAVIELLKGGGGLGLKVEFTEIPGDASPPDREAGELRITSARQAVLEDAIRRFPSDWVRMHERWRMQPGGP